MLASTEQQQIVHLVDGGEPFRVATCRLLEEAGFKTLSHSSAASFTEAQPQAPRGCVILDIHLPGETSGLELQEEMNRRNDIQPLIFLTAHGDIPTSVRAIKAGAFEFLTKPVPPEILIEAVEGALALEWETWNSRNRYQDRLDRLMSLTKCEREIFLLMVTGQTHKQICEAVGSAARTVSAHRAAVMLKMGITTTAQLVHQMHQLRLSLGEENFPTVRSLFESPAP